MTARRAQRVALACAGIALIAAGGAAAAAMAYREWRPSALVRMSASEPMATLARQADPNFQFVARAAHYDGVYYYAMARDPLARGAEHTLIDQAAYRYGHVGYAWLGRMVAATRARHMPLALLIVALTGMAVGAWAVSRVASQIGRTPWGGLIVALNPGLIYAVTTLTSEPVGIAFAALGMLFWLRDRSIIGVLWLAAACMVKETFVLIPAALFGWELIRRLREGHQPGMLRRLGLLVAAPVPFGLWYLYLRFHFDQWPFEFTRGFFEWPFTGWAETFRIAARYMQTEGLHSQIGAVTVPLVAATGVAIAIAMARAVRLRSPVDAIFLPFGVLAFCLNWLSLLFPKDLIRELIVPLMLVPAVAFAPRVAPAVPAEEAVEDSMPFQPDILA